MKILFLSHYPIDDVWQRWKQGEFPAHHLWGAAHLQNYGVDVEILPYEKYRLLKQLSNKIKVLGDLDQQSRILSHTDHYDLICSAGDLMTLSLTLLRSLGLFKKPIVIFMHRSFNRNFLSAIFVKLLLAKHDKIICLSSKIRDQLIERFNVPEKRLAVLEWAIDIPFYDEVGQMRVVSPEDKSGLFFMASGKTDRDYETLINAFRGLDYSLKIFYGSKNFVLPISNPPSNVMIPVKPGEGNFFSFPELLEQYNKAYAVVIPLDIPAERTDTVTMLGITALLDAMAMGKPTIMTRNRLLDLDIEEEGIGIFVEPGDVEGWRKAIDYLANHPEEAKEMGYRARKLCEARYNLEDFTARLAALLKAVRANSEIF